MTKKIKVLQLQSNYNLSPSDLAEQIVKSLPEEKYEVVSAYLRGLPGEGDPESIAPKRKYFNFSRKETKGLRLGPLEKLRSYCLDEQFDVVIAHRFKPVHMLMILNRKLNFRSCIGIAHGFGDYDRLYRKLECRFLIKPNWKMVGVSLPVKKHLLASGAGFTERNTSFINNAIDVDAALEHLESKKAARRELGVPEVGMVFGTIGRLVPVKGQIYLIQAFEKIQNYYPNAHLIIVGGGRLEGELQDYVRTHNLLGRVHLLGHIDNAFRFASAFDVFVLPSLSEGLPLALLEAMAASVPVIGSDIPTIKPIINGVGRVTKCRDIQSLADAMCGMADLSSDELELLGEKHFKYLQENHSVTQFKKEYLSLVEESLRDGG